VTEHDEQTPRDDSTEGTPPDAPVEPAAGAPEEAQAPEPASEAPAEAPAEPAAEPASEAPAEPASEAPAEPASEAPAEPASEAPAEPAAEPAAEAPAADVEAPETPAPEEVAAEAVAPEPETVEAAPDADAAPTETPRSPADLAADARYIATGKRKSSVARVILMPGNGEFRLNGRTLEVYFPQRTHQVIVQQPLETAGYVGAVNVIARIHGGGISGQADAVRHGIAKALIEADPALRGELKRRQLLTRDPRVKERKKAGLKKARKRPQFSKR
jgi:small subunit ribosomal protein S9